MIPQRKPSTVGRSGFRNEIGAHGETLAADFLLQNGYEILGRNVQYSFGEIDILARKEDVIVLVEVKTTDHTNENFDSAYSLIKRKNRIARLMSIVSQNYPNCDIRMDLIKVVSGECFWIEGI